MSEIEKDEPPEPEVAHRPQQLRQCTVLVGARAQPDLDYPVGLFETEGEEGEPFLISIIAIAESEGRVVVAVPFSAWRRTVSRRKLPSQSLSKPVAATVGFVDRASEDDPFLVKSYRQIWVGLLNPHFEGCVMFDPDPETLEADIRFADESHSYLPEAAGLAELLERHFVFKSAASERREAEEKDPLTPVWPSWKRTLLAALTRPAGPPGASPWLPLCWFGCGCGPFCQTGWDPRIR